MLNWISEKIWAVVSLVPAVFVDKDSPHFGLVRALLGLLLIILVAYIFAIGPIRAAIRRNTDRRKHAQEETRGPG